MPSDSSGFHTTPPITDLYAQSTRMGSEAMIVMIQPITMSQINPLTGQLQAADTVETVVRAHGGRQLVLPEDFASPACPQWSASLIRTTNRLEITCAGSEFYRGTMPVSQPWVDDVTARAQTRTRRAVHSDVVMVTGPITDPASIDAVLYAGRASWVRIPLTIT